MRLLTMLATTLIAATAAQAAPPPTHGKLTLEAITGSAPLSGPTPEPASPPMPASLACLVRFLPSSLPQAWTTRSVTANPVKNVR